MAFCNSAYRKEVMDSVTSRYFTSLQYLEPSPFTGYCPKKAQALEESCESPRGTGNFMEIEQMWEDKWHGAAPVEGAVEAMLQDRPSALIGLLSSFKSRASEVTKSRSSIDDIQGTGNVLSSLRRLISKGRVEAVEEEFRPSSSGPCEAFADWPIPRYPDNHEWDD